MNTKQIRNTAKRAGYRNHTAVADRAIAGDPEARFAIFNQFVRQNPEHATSRAYRADTAGLGSAAVISHDNGNSHVDIPLMRRRCEQCV